MHKKNQYTLLVSSLPQHKRDLFDSEHTPVSEIQLNKRLQWLDEEDARDLALINEVLYWSTMAQSSDDDFVQHASRYLPQVSNEFFRRMIMWRLEMRTLIAALRHRQQGVVPTGEDEVKGFGRWPLMITRNWQQVDFGLGRHFPWLEEAARLIDEEQAQALEKLLLNLVWQQYERQGFGHYFDFEAVVIYVLRWDVINRWRQCEAQAALERFNRIVDQCMLQVEHD